MTSLKNIIQPIIFDSTKNIYAIGLCLKDGEIIKRKIYNKIYEHAPEYTEFLLKFGGEVCRDHYLNSNEWKNYYPGFSGFTVGVEITNKHETSYGYGFKDKKDGDIIFRSFLIDEKGSNYESETYKYIISNQIDIPEKKIKTDLLEIKLSDNNSYCYCPKISFLNILEIEDSIKHSLSAKNKFIFDFIKGLDKEFYILNYGVGSDYEKIYLISNNNKDLDNVYYFLDKINHLVAENSS